MKPKSYLSIAALLAAGVVFADAAAAPAQELPAQTPIALQAAQTQADALQDPLSPAVQTLMSFKESDAKFDVSELMEILRDKRHEGWVLAAYPDPKTAQPLIGAGFSLDLPAREHPQRDPLNARPFLEPSSAELWQAAGLAPDRLRHTLDEFHARLDKWNKKGFRRQIWNLEPQITEGDANALLRVGIVQAIFNAKAYCRNFDALSASQQMAITQLVYQMGVNLEEFSTFLTLINRGVEAMDEAAAVAKADATYWRTVQLSLVQSQWARLYRARATAVIAMLDPRYMDDPSRAEHNIGAILHPVRARRGRTESVRKASYARHGASAAKKRAGRTRKN